MKVLKLQQTRTLFCYRLVSDTLSPAFHRTLFYWVARAGRTRHWGLQAAWFALAANGACRGVAGACREDPADLSKGSLVLVEKILQASDLPTRFIQLPPARYAVQRRNGTL